MTEKQKDILISRMLECPGELSDSEIMHILEDDELHDIYRIATDLKAIKRRNAAINAADEWMLLMPKLAMRRRGTAHRLTRIAAMLACAILVTAAVFVTSNHEVPDQHLVAQNHETVYSDTYIGDINYPDTIIADEMGTDTPEGITDNIAATEPMIAQASTSPVSATDSEIEKGEKPLKQQEHFTDDVAMHQCDANIKQCFEMAEINRFGQQGLAGKIPFGGMRHNMTPIISLHELARGETWANDISAVASENSWLCLFMKYIRAFNHSREHTQQINAEHIYAISCDIIKYTNVTEQDKETARGILTTLLSDEKNSDPVVQQALRRALENIK